MRDDDEDSIRLPPGQLAAIDAALETLEEHLPRLAAMNDGERRGLSRLGPDSERFCRRTLMALLQNPHLVPQSLAGELSEANEELRALDQLRPRLLRLARLGQRASDVEMALGTDVLTAAIIGYALLERAGKHKGLEALRAGLSYRSSSDSDSKS